MLSWKSGRAHVGLDPKPPRRQGSLDSAGGTEAGGNMNIVRLGTWGMALAAVLSMACSDPAEGGDGPADGTPSPTDTGTDTAAGDTNPDAPAPDALQPDGVEDTDSGCTPKTCAGANAFCGAPDDGCGGQLDCGDCAAPLACSVEFECKCTPICVGKQCGEKDECGETCVLGSGCCVHDCDAEGDVQCEDGGIQTCGEWDFDACRDWSEPTACVSGVCDGDACCVAACEGKECGDDGCGAECGTCPDAAPLCGPDGKCATDCTPQCGGKECGSDGCGGDCGTCPAAAPNCDAGTCKSDGCTPDCEGKICGGNDGCGGSCPETPDCCNDECSDGDTKCVGDSVESCGNFDVTDSCVEWSSGGGNFCEFGCEGGKCKEEPPVPCSFPMAPIESIAGLGATGSGLCDGDNLLADDGEAAEFWSNQDGFNDWLDVPVTICRVLDFGELCTPSEICVEAWAGSNGCSGDGCGAGGCESCKGVEKTTIEVFSHETNSTMSYEWRFSMQVGATSDPGDVMCYSAGDKPLQYVMVCRSACITASASYNAFVDYVYLK